MLSVVLCYVVCVDPVVCYVCGGSLVSVVCNVYCIRFVICVLCDVCDMCDV